MSVLTGIMMERYGKKLIARSGKVIHRLMRTQCSDCETMEKRNLTINLNVLQIHALQEVLGLKDKDVQKLIPCDLNDVKALYSKIKETAEE